MEAIDSKKAEVLIDKYLNAETSLEEERQLRSFFSKSENIEDHLLDYKELFVDFAQEIESMDSFANNYVKQNIESKTKVRRVIFRLSSVASIAALFIVSFIIFSRDSANINSYILLDGSKVEDVVLVKNKANENLSKMGSLMNNIKSAENSLTIMQKANSTLESVQNSNSLLRQKLGDLRL